jgi:prepilin-type N-terminal cleavage/methylation domain-containing protein
MQVRQKGFSLIELLVIVVVIVIVAALAVPRLLASKMTPTETAAVGSLRTLNAAVGTYSSEYAIGYPAALSRLGPAEHPSAAAADLTDGLLASGTKSGYTFIYVPAVADANGVIHAFIIRANPAVPGQTDSRYFFTDQTGVITFAYGHPAGPSDVPL